MATDMSPTLPRDLNGCSHCGRDQKDLREPLKRCAGCAIVVYCGKTCQRNAWPSHKILCRPARGQVTDEEMRLYRELGYESAMEMMKAFTRWESAHYYSLAVMANCAVYKQGGVEYNLNSSRAWLVCLKSRRPELQDDNPVTAFHMEYAMMVDGTSDPFVGGSWERMVSDRRKQEVQIAKDWPGVRNFAGCIPTITIIDASIGHYPILDNYPIFHRLRPEEDDSRAIPIFKDIGTMCSVSILFGYIFHPPREADQAKPYVEQNVRMRKGWKPRPADERCWDLLCANPRSRPIYETGLSAPALWTRFKELSGVCGTSKEVVAILRGE